ncbi:multiple inositol polyphosphate phosphatase 1b isoform X1 [Narcine bancroftii]|uniref:multiple inositol polyphosphate phosphatase 1b isoform X1 n=1 Tax=Narcine bancroftii TaxID=1343680 RepID=UPI0038314B06
MEAGRPRRAGRASRLTELVAWACVSLCAASRPPWAEHYGTKSRYWAAGDVGSWLPPARCTQLHLSGLIRHGTRYPTRRNVPRMLEVHRLVKEQADAGRRLVQALAAWRMWYHERMDGRLHRLGASEMAGLAERLAAASPRLLTPQSYREQRVKFLTSSKHRCVNSTSSFIRGLQSHLGLGDQGARQWEVNDELLRFFDSCQKYVRSVGNNDTALHQMELFKQGPEVQRVIQNVAKKLGLLPGAISCDMVETTFYLCIYEFTLKGVVSPWCDLFDKEDVEVLEYLGDLKQYWKTSYGYEINGLSSHKLFQNIFQYIDQTIEENERNQPISHSAVLRFGHAETLLPVLTLLGYFKDEHPLLANNFEEQRDRKFRSGRISPLAANLIFVLYQCNETQSLGEKYKLQLFLNERPLPFPQTGNLIAGYDEVKNHYQHLIDALRFSNMTCS